MTKSKFSYLYAFVLMIALLIAMFLFRGDKDITVAIVTSLVGGFGAVTAHFYKNDDK